MQQNITSPGGVVYNARCVVATLRRDASGVNEACESPSPEGAAEILVPAAIDDWVDPVVYLEITQDDGQTQSFMNRPNFANVFWRSVKEPERNLTLGEPGASPLRKRQTRGLTMWNRGTRGLTLMNQEPDLEEPGV